MKFTAAIAATLIGLSSASALPKRNTTVQELDPEAISIYHVWTGEIEYDVTQGYIMKTQASSDLTTLATFDFATIPAGSTCQFLFVTDTSYAIDGTPQFDVFEADHIVTADQATWPTSSIRQRQLGRLEAVEEDVAKVVFTDKGFTFPCPTKKSAYELVPTGDISTITWDEATDGAYVEWW